MELEAPILYNNPFPAEDPSMPNKSIPTSPIPAKGHVEIINMHGGSYWNIYLDGELVDQTYKEMYDASVLRRSNRREWASSIGVHEDDLRYTCYDLYHGLSGASFADYDANDYEEYAPLMAFLASENIKPDYVAQDLDFVEANV